MYITQSHASPNPETSSQFWVSTSPILFIRRFSIFRLEQPLFAIKHYHTTQIHKSPKKRDICPPLSIYYDQRYCSTFFNKKSISNGLAIKSSAPASAAVCSAPG